MNKKQGYINISQIDKNKEFIKKYKIFVPKAFGNGNIKEDVIKPILADRDTCCSDTYILIGCFDEKKMQKM